MVLEQHEGGPLATIEDRESLERWLAGRPHQDLRAVATRAALRSMPALEEYRKYWGDQNLTGSALLLDVLRACAVAQAIATYPHRLHDLLGPAYSAVFKAYAHPAYEAAKFALSASLPNDSDYNEYDDEPPNNDCVAGYAVACAADALGDAVWSAVRADAKSIDAGVLATSLSTRPLWPGGLPSLVREKWGRFKSTLHSHSVDHWDVWIDWYDARLRGELCNEEEEIARILEVTEEEWAAGPPVTNKKIKDVGARFQNTSPAAPSYVPRVAIKGHAFISHASQFDGVRASALAIDLEAAGIRCWIAPRDIPSGADWNGTIVSAIDSCHAMILLVSDAALKSPFVKAEVQHAFERGKRVFPVRIADSIDAGQIDLRLKIVQHIDGRCETQAVVARILKSLG